MANQTKRTRTTWCGRRIVTDLLVRARCGNWYSHPNNILQCVQCSPDHVGYDLAAEDPPPPVTARESAVAYPPCGCEESRRLRVLVDRLRMSLKVLGEGGAVNGEDANRIDRIVTASLRLEP